jgi:hypothetical protein
MLVLKGSQGVIALKNLEIFRFPNEVPLKIKISMCFSDDSSLPGLPLNYTELCIYKFG